MNNRNRRSANPGSSSSPSQDDPAGFTNQPTNQPTSANEFNGANNTGPSRPTQQHWSSYATAEILRAHLDAGAHSDSDDSSSEPRVHPDFFVYLERLRRVNETNRVNARREAEARYEAYQASRMLTESQELASRMLHNSQYEASLMLNASQHQASRMINDSQNQASRMLNESQHQASRILNESHHGSSQFANEPDQASQRRQPSSYTDAEHGSQSSAMGMRERHETQAPTTAVPFDSMSHVRFEAPDSVSDAHLRDRSHHHRPPSPYPMDTQHQPSTGPSSMANPPVTAPQPPRYTDRGNPYTLRRERAPFPEGAVPCSPERILQAWLIRQQLIVGVRPENLQPMSVPRGLQHRTPPYIILNQSGAHILRIEPARFDGVMLPMLDLPWFPRRPNPESSTAPVSTNTPDASNPSPAPNTTTAPTSDSPINPPSVLDVVVPELSSESPINPPSVPDMFVPELSSASPINPPLVPDVVVPDLPSTPWNSPVRPYLRAAPTVHAAPHSFEVSYPDSVPEQILGYPSQHVAESQNRDLRVVAFSQPLRLHEPVDSVSTYVSDPRPEGPSTPEPALNENSQIPVAATQSQLQASMRLTVQNRTDTDSISSREGLGQDQEPSTVSSVSNEGTEPGHAAPPEATPSNGVVSHAITWSESEDPDEPASPRLRRFVIDGADDLLGVGRLSGEAKASGDQSSLEG
ncbi:uncharacterized protein N7479_005324 [Penicillium vulpinum]|uniref:Uncharacterized protein n=1 Tax=Penicillium vulpinum TaxID=29845 RepID=A0A1V6RK40_9EURO|nr:uncharacterized protein N7479_005324 [Penicillium vulpinum]KAJ5958174.1 hypothetical protein N7479_005324 [Penicillium vulpinum]OQE02177.1 hypothetical protein PENVUL_c040G03616 [Penicillium vulpinum]